MNTASPIADYKYLVFVFGLATLLVFEAGLKYALSENLIRWDMRMENLVPPLLIAFACEKYVQWKLRLTSRWIGRGERHVKKFLIYFVAWSTCIWLTLPGVLNSDGVLSFFINVSVIYLFSGAFFEICNLIKVGGEK